MGSVKGQRIVIDGDRFDFVFSRDILIPLSLAADWDRYRANARNSAFAARLKGLKGATRIKSASDAVHLFLREADGKRFKGAELYSAWTGVELPFDGWSPHKGRHWWACSVLWREMKSYKNVAFSSKESTLALINGAALGIIQLQIQPQLGHSDKRTTMLYLIWVMEMLALPLALDMDNMIDIVEHE